MKRTLTLRAALLALPLLLVACSTTREDTNYTSVSANAFVAANYRAADALALQLRGKLADEKPLIMATIVNIDARSNRPRCWAASCPSKCRPAWPRAASRCWR